MTFDEWFAGQAHWLSNEKVCRAIFLWICFLGWLMWSSEEQKQSFLFYTWATMLGSGIIVFLLAIFR